MIQVLALCAAMLLQSGQTTLRAQQRPAETPLAEILSNKPDQVQANKPFTLLLVYDPVAQNDQASNWLYRVLQSPQSEDLRRWMAQCNFRPVSINSPHAEKLRWHLQKHQQLPVLMLQESPGTDGEGATWYSAGGPEIPLNEAALVTELQRWYTATVNASKKAGTLDSLPSSQPLYPDNYVFPRRNLAPSTNAFSERKPLINPRVDITVPDTINTRVEAALKPETLRVMVIVGFIFLGCALAIAYAMIHSARIIGEAITDDPDAIQTEVSNGP
jgi:hypothetical protein